MTQEVLGIFLEGTASLRPESKFIGSIKISLTKYARNITGA
jgi:hypothetical protein